MDADFEFASHGGGLGGRDPLRQRSHQVHQDRTSRRESKPYFASETHLIEFGFDTRKESPFIFICDFCNYGGFRTFLWLHARENLPTQERERLRGIFAFYQVRVSVNCAAEEGNFDRRERDVCLSETSLAPLKWRVLLLHSPDSYGAEIFFICCSVSKRANMRGGKFAESC